MSNVSVYLSIPIRHCEQAHLIETFLEKKGISVLNPCHITPVGIAKELIPASVASQCIQMIERSTALVLFVDYYGRDCATEVGYAIARRKPVFPVSLSGQNPFLEQDWMIKPFIEPLSNGIEQLQGRLQTYFERQKHLSGT